MAVNRRAFAAPGTATAYWPFSVRQDRRVGVMVRLGSILKANVVDGNNPQQFI